MPTDDQALREMAQHRGYRLVKSRRRKPGGDYGRYGLKEVKSGKSCFGFGEAGLEASSGEIEEFLRGRAHSDWKTSLSAPDALRKESRRNPPAAKAEPAPTSTASVRRTVAKIARAPEPEPKATSKSVPKPELLIREAVPKDAGGIAALMQSDDAPDNRRIAKLIATLASEGRPVLVAQQGAVIGCVSYDLIRAIHHAAPLGRIAFLATAAGERRRGVGSALLKAAEARLRKLGCGTIEMVNMIELSNANGFLRRHAYQRSGYRFAKQDDS